MTKTITAAGYITHDRDGIAIYGMGNTPDEAWAELLEFCSPFFDSRGNEIAAEVARETQFVTVPASAALMEQVRREGGCISWSWVNDVACAESETER